VVGIIDLSNEASTSLWGGVLFIFGADIRTPGSASLHRSACSRAYGITGEWGPFLREEAFNVSRQP
jgi:hypothetical protein